SYNVLLRAVIHWPSSLTAFASPSLMPPRHERRQDQSAEQDGKEPRDHTSMRQGEGPKRANMGEQNSGRILIARKNLNKPETKRGVEAPPWIVLPDQRCARKSAPRPPCLARAR